MYEFSDSTFIAVVVISFVIGYGLATFYCVLKMAGRCGQVEEIQSDRIGVNGARTEF